MAVVTGLTADRMIQIEQQSLVGVRRDGDNLIFIAKSGIETDLGDIKGDKGDTGDVGISAIEITYSSAVSGTVAPGEDSFSSEIPTVAPGAYLWTRTTFIGPEGNPLDSVYTSTRQGVNGTINSINGKTGGDITLTAADIPGTGLPVGTSLDFRGTTAPAGFLLEDGASYSRADYPALFAVIGTTYGFITSSTFRVPDSRGRVSVGLDPADTDLDTVAKKFGSKAHLLTTSEIPTLTAESGGAHAHTATASTVGSHNHGGATGSTRPDVGASNADTTNMPATVATLRVASGSGLQIKALAESYHTHSIASDGGHTHSVTVNSGGAHTHTVNSGTTTAHQNMQPSLVALKIIKF